MRDVQPTIVPAIMASEWEDLVSQVNTVAHIAPQVQIDVMDGQLVPSFSFPYNKTFFKGQRLPYLDALKYEIHLMVQHPKEVGHQFIAAGAQRIIAQIEGFREGEEARVLQEWRAVGAETGVSLMLDTDLANVDPLLEKDLISIVQIMSIARVGFQGEKFDPRALVRIKELRTRYPDVTIAVDGSVNESTLEPLLDVGVDQFGVGSAIMKADTPSAAYAHLQQLLESYAQRFQNRST